ncbi:MAG: NUDIX domain-containing protein [Candidatus Aenigmarchaeota archaeon]|nr:NUDIX domain-containing protein [Candidatus Aenigmarchaeota archaeon]
MKNLSHGEYNYIFSRVPRICVDVVVKDKDGVILTKRAIEPWKGFWHLPGGMIFFNEKIEDAVKRVAQDELGIRVKIEKLLGHIEYLNEVRKRRRNHSISIAFQVKPLSKTLKTNWQATDAKFFKTAPRGIIPIQLRLLRKNRLIK